MTGRIWPFLLTAGVLVLDRATKHAIETRVADWESIAVIPGLFQIVHTRNTGIAFGMFAGEAGGAGSKLLLVVTSAVMAFIAWMLWHAIRPGSKEHWTLKGALALVLGGAVGNLYDRVAFGSVTDFLDFHWGASHFPVFNVADSAITVGAGLLLLNLWFSRHASGGPWPGGAAKS
jgi:signal peptidase II